MSENVLSGVLTFAKVTKPVFGYESDVDKEFTIDIVVDEETYDNFVEKYPKQKGKIVKTSEFEGIYKFKPVFPNEKKQFILKLKKNATYKDKTTGDIVNIKKQYWPKLFLKKGGKVTIFPANTLIGNGSVGKVSFEDKTNNYGTFAKLKQVLVESLVKYEEKDGNDFGMDEDIGNEDFADDGDGGLVKVPVSAKTANKSPVKAKVKPQDDDEDSELPF